ncbi:hypothetical protein JTE90_010034 [Oedothorax gibbosus]|uniref:CBM21 domain-containing protein n=1 Tax=Oedothorax gibbosus TaxID=931172 RepID=A0AAV6V322_9ARAC|nr:hypothetical protein JTE90_010034 [Oedothorax gibbosus]
MLKRKRSYSNGGSLTSSCRIRAEALARAFNSRIWPCMWRSVEDSRHEENDEEFYEADENFVVGGRDRDLTITSEQVRAKFCRELLHAVDDVADVFYDVSEHAGLTAGKVTCESPVGKCEESSSRESSAKCSVNDVESRKKSNNLTSHNYLLNETDNPTNCVINEFDKSLTECNSLCESCRKSSNVYLNDVEDIETSNDLHSHKGLSAECESRTDIVNEFEKSSNACDFLCESSKKCSNISLNNIENSEICDGFDSHNPLSNESKLFNAVNDLEKSSNECESPEKILGVFLNDVESHATSIDFGYHNQLSIEHDHHTSNILNEFSESCVKYLNESHDSDKKSFDIHLPNKDLTSNDSHDSVDNFVNDSLNNDKKSLDLRSHNQLSTDNNCEISNNINTADISCEKPSNEFLNCDKSPEIISDIPSHNDLSNEHDYTSSAINTYDESFKEPSTSSECLKLTDNCEISKSITNFRQYEYSKKEGSCVDEINNLQSTNECLYSSDNRDEANIPKSSKDTENTIQLENSLSTYQCATTQSNNSDIVSNTNSKDIIGADKIIDINNSIENFTGPNSCDYPSEKNSDSTIAKLNTAQELSDSGSLECLNNKKYDITIITTEKIRTKECENEFIEYQDKNSYSAYLSGDLDDDLRNSSILENMGNCSVTADTFSNPIQVPENLELFDQHIEFSNISSDKNCIASTMGCDNQHIFTPENEEVLTVVIHTDSFDITQTPKTILETTPQVTYQLLDDQINITSDCPIINSPEETIELTNISDSSVASPEANDLISSLNKRFSNALFCEELLNDNQSNFPPSSRCLELKSDPFNFSDEIMSPVKIELSSPIHSKEPCEISELESLEDKYESRLRVFDEKRPMISRSTSLKTGKTPPGTPSRKKIVRFADVLGLDLEDVRHIISGDVPNVPSSAFSDLDIAKGHDPVTQAAPQSMVVDLTCRQQSTWESVPGAVGTNALYPLFAIPGQQPDFMERLRATGVCLETVVIADCNVQCSCRVMNWGYNKRVLARYTTNGWASSSDINASYVSDSTRDGADSFAFNIFLNRERSDLQFAILYEVNGNQYWDNNGGKNYCFSYHGHSANQTSVQCSPTWMEPFW